MTTTNQRILTQHGGRRADELDLAWQLRLGAPPRRVFGALVHTASERGRLLSVENFGQSLVFAPSRCALYPCPPLRAVVARDGSGSLLTFAPARRVRDARAVAAEAESVGSLIRELREHFAPPAA
ncbi:MAG: hypothetical protein JOZ82_12970 [Marmoricola sp.]|nr:hypothetical protein [Marmoricola sp.]